MFIDLGWTTVWGICLERELRALLGAHNLCFRESNLEIKPMQRISDSDRSLELLTML